MATSYFFFLSYSSNGDFLAFLGIVDEVREVSVRFCIGPMGVTLSPNGPYTEITNMKSLPDGSPSPAQANGLIRVGYRVFRVNGEDVLTRDYATVIHKIQQSKRPMIIHFLGHLKEGNPVKGTNRSGNSGEISFVPSVDEEESVANLSEALKSNTILSPPPRTISFSSFMTSLDDNTKETNSTVAPVPSNAVDTQEEEVNVLPLPALTSNETEKEEKNVTTDQTELVSEEVVEDANETKSKETQEAESESETKEVAIENSGISTLDSGSLVDVDVNN